MCRIWDRRSIEWEVARDILYQFVGTNETSAVGRVGVGRGGVAGCGCLGDGDQEYEDCYCIGRGHVYNNIISLDINN